MTANAPVVVDLKSPRSQILVAMADDELITGQLALAWTGFAPSLEEDLAFSTIAQDEINHADLWYQVLLGTAGGIARRAEVDAVALGRQPHEYRHAIVCELAAPDYIFALARHWCYDHADRLRLASLVDSLDEDIADVAAKLLHEERFHVEHADQLISRVAMSGDDNLARLVEALNAVVPDSLALFEAVPGEEEAYLAGVVRKRSQELQDDWLAFVSGRLDVLGLASVVQAAHASGPGRTGGRSGIHTASFIDEVWADMTRMHREFPGARW